MKRFIICALFCAMSLLSTAQQLRVAVAANAQSVLKKLADDFSQRTRIYPEIIVSSSGKLAAQIEHGAPYDIFLSADMFYPLRLAQKGLTVGEPEVYALGSLIICSKMHNIKYWKRELNASTTVAIANPKLAPYGEAAQQYLQQQKLWGRMNKNLILGESIAQVNTYISRGIVDFAFTTESLIYEGANKQSLSWTRIPKSAYAPLGQGIVWLKRAKSNVAAEEFYHYLLSDPAKHIFRQYGYQTP